MKPSSEKALLTFLEILLTMVTVVWLFIAAKMSIILDSNNLAASMIYVICIFGVQRFYSGLLNWIATKIHSLKRKLAEQ
jgi:anaerobic C4-dicarboxylate transporter